MGHLPQRGEPEDRFVQLDFAHPLLPGQELTAKRSLTRTASGGAVFQLPTLVLVKSRRGPTVTGARGSTSVFPAALVPARPLVPSTGPLDL